MRTPRLTERLVFLSRDDVDDGAGNRRGELVERFAVWAEMKSRPSSESFTAARLEGRVPYAARIRMSPDATQIRTDWVARDSRGVEYDVRAPQLDLITRAWVDMTLVSGGRTG